MRSAKYVIINLLFLGLVQAQPVPQSLKDKIQGAVDASHANNGLKGVGVTVAFPNGAMWSTSAGIISDGVPIDTSKYFRFASYTKFLTSIMIMQLHESGQISIDDSLKKYLFPIPNVDGDLTIRDLLRHTATVGDYFQNASAVVQQNPDSVFDTRQTLIDHIPGTTNPSKNYSYNNSNFNILGLILEAVTGNSGVDEFDTRLTQPLALTDVHLAPVNLPSSALNGTWFDPGSGLIDVGSVSVNGILTAHRYSGGAVGTTRGMLSILRAHLHNTYLNEETLQLMNAPSPKNQSYGLGTMIRNVAGDQLYGHGGATAQSTRTFYNPTNNIGVSVGINHSHSHAVESLFQNIYILTRDELATLDVEAAFTPGRNFRLNQNYPNPFNPSTTISYELSERSQVELVIYNVQGSEIWSVQYDAQDAGQHEIMWNGNDRQNNSVETGIYFAQMTSEGETQTIKLMLLK